MHDVSGAFQVGLVGIEYHGHAVSVVLAHKINSPAVDGRLVDLLLSIDEYPSALGSGLAAQLLDR